MLTEFNAAVKKGEEAARAAMGPADPEHQAVACAQRATRAPMPTARSAMWSSGRRTGSWCCRRDGLTRDLEHWHYDTFKVT